MKPCILSYMGYLQLRGWLRSLGMLLDILLYSVLHQIHFSDLGSIMSSWQPLSTHLLWIKQLFHGASVSVRSWGSQVSLFSNLFHLVDILKRSLFVTECVWSRFLCLKQIRVWHRVFIKTLMTFSNRHSYGVPPPHTFSFCLSFNSDLLLFAQLQAI